MNRRNFLAGTAGGMALLAGCSSPSGSSDDSDSEVKWPKVTDTQIDRWTKTGERKQKYEEKYGVTPHERTYLYENTALREAVKQKTLGQFDSTLAMFFASHIDLRGLTTAAARPSRIGKQLVPKFREQMEDNGIQNVREVSAKNPKPSPSSGTEVYEFQGTYSTPKITKEVDIPDVGKKTLSIEADQLAITGLVAIWKTESGHAFAAGGAFPAEPYDKSDTISVTGDEGGGIDVTVSIDLGLRARRLRREIIGLSESVTM